MKDKLKDKKVKCRICNGEHFTARCPFKDTMAPEGEGSADVAAGPADAVEGPGGLGSGKSSYVPPHMRNGASAGAGDRMGGGKYERDDLATLRVTNVSCLVLNPAHRANHVYRFRRWQKNKSSEICSSVLVGSRECSWRRIERLVLQKDLLSSVSKREPMLRRLARRWTVMDSSI
jgi:hypothetical protein